MILPMQSFLHPQGEGQRI